MALDDVGAIPDSITPLLFARPDVTPPRLVDPVRMCIGPKRDLLPISGHLETLGLQLGSPPVVLAAFQDAANFSDQTACRYEALAARRPLVVAHAAGLSAGPAGRVRGADVAADDPLLGEWVVVGRTTPAPSLPPISGTRPGEADHRFRFPLTHDHETVVRATWSLLGRVALLLS